MKKAQLKELATQLLGSITDRPEVLEQFSTDGSLFQVSPSAVVFPQNTADVRKVVKYVSEQAAAGKHLSLVARGQGSGQAGGALGDGVQLVTPAHLHKLLRLDHDLVTVQPGMDARTLQQVLATHGRWSPALGAEPATGTVGGAVAQNASAASAVKYGTIRDWVKGLKVVLADGSLVETRRIGARELNRKKGLSTLEGEVYRKLDSLLLDHAAVIKKRTPKTTVGSSGYALDRVRKGDGSFDLGQIMIGAEGTLGIITEITLGTAPHNPRTTLVVGYFDTMVALAATAVKLRKLGPSTLEMVDRGLLEFVRRHYPGDLTELLPEGEPHSVLLAEFDDPSQLAQKVKSSRAQRLLTGPAVATRVTADPVAQVALWKLRRASAVWSWLADAPKPALPLANAAVPPAQLGTLLDKTYKLLAKHDLDAAVWGGAGDGRLHLEPRLDLSKKRDVDKLFSLSREFHELVVAIDGAVTAGAGDGLWRACYLGDQSGEDMAELFAATKHIFDPHSIFSPLHKTEATEAYARAHLRTDFTPRYLDRFPST